MKHASKGQGRPAWQRLNLQQQATPIDRELLELERRKLVALAGGTVVLTRAGYAELVRRGLVRGGS